MIYFYLYVYFYLTSGSQRAWEGWGGYYVNSNSCNQEVNAPIHVRTIGYVTDVPVRVILRKDNVYTPQSLK